MAVVLGAVGHATSLFAVYCLRWNASAMWAGGLFGLTTTFVTGLCLVATTLIIFVGSRPFIRRSGKLAVDSPWAGRMFECSKCTDHWFRFLVGRPHV